MASTPTAAVPGGDAPIVSDMAASASDPVPAKKPGRIKADERATFLEVLAASGVVAKAAKTIGRAAASVYALRRREAGFAADWEDALDQHRDSLREIAVQRAVKGIEKPIYHAGQKVGAHKEYSEKLLLWLLDKRTPTALPAARADAAESAAQAEADAALLATRLAELMAARPVTS